jgi:transposase-like protein
MSHDRRFWKRVVTEAERSKLTHAGVAEHHGVSVAALRSWIYRLRRERAGTGPSEPRLLPVRVTPSPVVRESLEIVVGETLVRVPAGTDPAYVASLVAALRAC